MEILGEILNICVIVLFVVIGIFMIVSCISIKCPSKKKLDEMTVEYNKMINNLKFDNAMLDNKLRKAEGELSTSQKTFDALDKTIKEQKKDIDKLKNENKKLEYEKKDLTEKYEKEIKKLNDDLSEADELNIELRNQNPEEVTNQLKIQHELWKEQAAFEQEMSVNFLKEFKNAIADDISLSRLVKSVENGALSRAFAVDNSSIRIRKLKSFNVSAEVISKRIDGSDGGPYEVTLKSCQCDNFVKRHGKLPCKHMVYLAYALGILQQDVAANGKVAEQHEKMRQELNEYRRQKRQ